MTGVHVQIKSTWRHCYRAPGTPIAGIVQETAPSGNIARVRFDHVADSYIFVAHLEPVQVELAAEPALRAAESVV